MQRTKISNKTGLILSLLIAVMVCCTLYTHCFTEDFYKIEILTGSAVIAAIIVILYFHWEKTPKANHYAILILICEEIIGISFLVNGLHFHTLAYLFIGAFFCVGLPVIHYSFSAVTQEKLIYFLSRGIEYSYYVFLVITLLFSPPYFRGQFSSVIGNPNGFGNYLIVLVPAFLYLIWQKREKFSLLTRYILLLVSTLTFVFLSGSRTTALAVVLECICFIIFLIKEHKAGKREENQKTGKAPAQETQKKDRKKTTGRIILLIVAAILVVGIQFFTVTTVRTYLYTTFEETGRVRNIFTERFGEDIYDDYTLPDSNCPDGNCDMDENSGTSGILQQLLRKFGKGMQNNNGDAFTSGRIGIWDEFLSQIGLMGHKQETLAVNEAERHYTAVHAHNVYLQVAYSAGAIAGIAYLLLVIAAIIVGLKFLLSKKFYKAEGRLEKLIACCFTLGFFAMTLFSDGYMLFRYLPPTFFFLTLHSFMARET